MTLPSKIRVCFLIHRLNDGGAQRQLTELVRVLDKSRFDVSVISLYDGGRFQEEMALLPGVKLIVIGKSYRWDILGPIFRLIRATRQIRPHILHGYLSLGNILAVLLKPCVRNMRVVWGLRSSGLLQQHESRVTRFLSRIERKLAGLPDLFIANSYAGRSYFEGIGFPAGRCLVIHNGIDTDTFVPHEEARQEMRLAWGIGPDIPLIGIIGRVSPEKDHATFLKAAAQALQVRPELRFVVIGGGNSDYVQEMKTLAASLNIADCVLWTGSIGMMSKVHNALDLLALTSPREGFPNVVGEAMATGVPCVVTDVGDAALMVECLGGVCPAGDAAAIAQNILSVLEKTPRPLPDLRQRKSIVSRFGLEVLKQKTEDALCRLV